MAEQAEEGEVRVVAPASPGVSVKLVIVAALLALLVGGGGAVVLVKFLGNQAETGQTQIQGGRGGAAGGQNPGGDPGSLGTVVGLEPFIVNLADYPDVRYLKVTINAAIPSPEAEETLKTRRAPIRDTILVLLSSKESKELQTPQGKYHLREEITQRINAVLPIPIVKKVYFTEFVVQ